MFARLIFSIVDFGARKGLSTPLAPGPDNDGEPSAKQRARRTGVRGETYAYWYLRRHGYILVARNFTYPGIKGEVDMVGYDGSVLAFVEVKTRTILESANSSPDFQRTPEDAVDWENDATSRAWPANFFAPATSKARNVVSMFSQSKRGAAQNLACVFTKARSTPTAIDSASSLAL